MDLYSGRPLESTTDHRPHYHEASLTNMSKPGDNVIIRDDLSIMLPCCVVVSDWQATLSSSILQCFDEGRFCDMTFKFSSNEVLQVHRVVVESCCWIGGIGKVSEPDHSMVDVHPHISPSLLYPLIRFLYTGAVTLTEAQLQLARDIRLSLLLNCLLQVRPSICIPEERDIKDNNSTSEILAPCQLLSDIAVQLRGATQSLPNPATLQSASPAVLSKYLRQPQTQVVKSNLHTIESPLVATSNFNTTSSPAIKAAPNNSQSELSSHARCSLYSLDDVLIESVDKSHKTDSMNVHSVHSTASLGPIASTIPLKYTNSKIVSCNTSSFKTCPVTHSYSVVNTTASSSTANDSDAISVYSDDTITTCNYHQSNVKYLSEISNFKSEHEQSSPVSSSIGINNLTSTTALDVEEQPSLSPLSRSARNDTLSSLLPSSLLLNTSQQHSSPTDTKSLAVGAADTKSLAVGAADTNCSDFDALLRHQPTAALSSSLTTSGMSSRNATIVTSSLLPPTNSQMLEQANAATRRRGVKTVQEEPKPTRFSFENFVDTSNQKNDSKLFSTAYQTTLPSATSVVNPLRTSFHSKLTSSMDSHALSESSVSRPVFTKNPELGRQKQITSNQNISRYVQSLESCVSADASTPSSSNTVSDEEDITNEVNITDESVGFPGNSSNSICNIFSKSNFISNEKISNKSFNCYKIETKEDRIEVVRSELSVVSPRIEPSCSKSNKDDLTTHAKIISEVLKKYPRLVKDKKNVKLKIMQKVSSNNINCPTVCSKRSATYARYLKHNSHSRAIDNNLLLCKECKEPKSFRTASLLRDHKRSVHSLDRLICCECNIRYSSKLALYYHKYKVHDIEPPLGFMFPKCKVCKLVCRNKVGLMRHSSTHEDSEGQNSNESSI